MQGEDYVRITPVLPTRELATPCYQRVNWCGAPGSPGYDLPITPGISDSPAPPIPRDFTLDGSDQPLTTLRGARVEVDPRRAARVAVALCVVALAVVAVSLSVAGVDKNAEITGLRQQGTPVVVTVTRCFGLLGGSGSNGVGNSCLGTFVLDGKRYKGTIPGDALWAPGTTIRLVTIRSDPGLLATEHQVASEHASWRVFILPTVLFFGMTALVTVLIVRRRRDLRKVGSVGSPPIGQLRGQPLPG
jgi:hypothetical protein